MRCVLVPRYSGELSVPITSNYDTTNRGTFADPYDEGLLNGNIIGLP